MLLPLKAQAWLAQSKSRVIAKAEHLVRATKGFLLLIFCEGSPFLSERVVISWPGAYDSIYSLPS